MSEVHEHEQEEHDENEEHKEQEQQEEENGETLYDKVSTLSKMSYDPETYNSTNEYKADVIRNYYNELSYDDYNALDEDVAAWVQETTQTMKDNKNKKLKSDLPFLAGLDEVKETKRRVRKAKADGEVKEKRERKVKEPKPPKVRKENRFIRTMRVISRNPNISPDALSAEAGISTPREAGYYIDFYVGAVKALEEAGYKDLPMRHGGWVTLGKKEDASV